MSITELKRTINYGDFVVLWAGRDYLYPLTVTKGEKLGNNRGEFSHDDMIGKKYGGKLYSKNRKGFVYALSLTPEIWTRALKFRTQILYGVDISVICFHLELRPGSVVLEAGTGSGSLSTSMARCIAPHGKLYTFEFNKDRVEAAKVDFKQSKIDNIVTVTWRDIYKDGFQTKETANAIFLDLPSPWLVIDSVKEALVPDGKFCGFSPCIEQVQKTSSALRKTGFIDIYTIECLIRPNDLKNVSLQKLVLQHHEEAASTEESTKKRKTEEQSVESESKNEMQVEKPAEEEEKQAADEEAKPVEKQRGKRQKKEGVFETRPLAKPIADIRGHTGYLTFARKPVLEATTNKT